MTIEQDPMGLTNLTSGQKWALAGVILLGAALAFYGFAGSYTTLFRLAAQHAVPLPRLNPIGVDGGLVGVVALDIVLAWVGSPIAWLRQLARVLTVATVTLNAIGGWPDPVAITLHTFAPVMILAMVEAARTVLLRRAGKLAGLYRDPIPLARWLLDVRTFGLYRRMVLWQQTSYRAAVDIEIERRRAIMTLRAEFGRRWRRRAPRDLVWMIRSGVRIDDALNRVRALTVDPTGAAQSDGRLDSAALALPSGESTPRVAPPPAGRPVDSAPPVDRPTIEAARVRESTSRPESNSPDSPTAEVDQPTGEVDPLIDRAREVNAESIDIHRRPVSAEALRRELGIGSARARALRDVVHAEDGRRLRAVGQ